MYECRQREIDIYVADDNMSKSISLQLCTPCVFLLTCFVVAANSPESERDEMDNLPNIGTIAKSLDVAGPQFLLWVTGTFMAAHKYFGADVRYTAGVIEKEDQVFHMKFPSPALRDFHPKVVAACDQGAMSCVGEVFKTAMVSGTLQHITRHSRDELVSYSPFSSDYELFKYRQTAAYYLCWYTLRQEPFMQYTAKSMKNQTCLSYLHAVDEVPKSTRENLIREKGRIIVDVRDDKNYPSTSPFTCAEMWFCPDPCYGKKEHGNFKLSSGDVDGNPCRVLKNKRCAWKLGANTNFRDLIKNKINITCDCQSNRKGFEFNNQFELCIDKDECFDGTADCPSNRICKNSVGSYDCTCPRGYHVNKESDNCDRMNVLHQSVTLLKYNPDTQNPADEDFISELLDWVGLSGGNSNILSFGNSVTIVMLFIFCIDFFV